MARPIGPRTVIISGDKQLLRMLNQLKTKDSKKIVRTAARRAAKLIVPAAKRYAPVNTGELRRAIKVRALPRSRKRIGVRVMIGNENFQGKTFYGSFQEWGWKSGSRKKQAVVESVGVGESPTKGSSKKIPGKFFLKRAADENRLKVFHMYRAEVRRGVLELMARNGAR